MAGIEQYEWYKELIATPHGRALVNDLQATCAARMNVSQQEATEGERLPTIREKYYPDSNALRTFAHHDEILVGIADRHKENFDEAQVIDVAINCLDGGDWLTLDNPTFYIVSWLQERAALFRLSRESFKNELRVMGQREGRLLALRHLEAEAERRKELEMRIERQNNGLGKGRKNANAKRTRDAETRRSEAKRLFAEWRGHSLNLTASNEKGYAHVASIFSGWKYTTANGDPYTGATIKEYLRAPRKRNNDA